MRPQESGRRLTMKQIAISGLLVFIVVSYGNQEYCPQMCSCNVVSDMNKADCSGQKLINAQIDMPKEVEILDLSQNDISVLDKESFRDLKHLVFLQLANNTIHTIDLEAFEKLKKLEFLDLSYNRLSVFDEKIIENNHNLVTLKLRGNKFMYLEDDPILKSQSLQNLDLHNSQLTRASFALFKNVPNLLSLDLSNNLLITLDKDSFKNNKKLKILNLRNNPWNCDSNLEATLKWLKRRHVDVDIPECPIPRSKPMFERMQMDPLGQSSAPLNTKTNIKIESVWKTHKYDMNKKLCPLDNAEEACDMFESCVSNFTNFYKEVDYKLEYANKIRKKRMEHLFGTEFYIGLVFGAMIGGSVIYICLLFASLINKSKRQRRQVSNENSAEIAYIREQSNTTQQRTNGIRSPSANNREVARQNSTSFFGRLFQRPTRRRYYTAFNENATNLVRRLSQSRLFLNRDSSRQTANQSSTSDVTRLILNGGDVSHASPTAPSEEMIYDTNLNSPPPRPETPPPAYKDIIG